MKYIKLFENFDRVVGEQKLSSKLSDIAYEYMAEEYPYANTNIVNNITFDGEL